MANANIHIVLSDGRKAGETINELRQQANRLNKEINNLKPGSDEFIKKSADYKKVTDRLGDVRKEAKGVSTATKGMISEMMQFIPFGGQIQAVSGKVGLLSGGFKTLRAAIISTGIGALVVVLGSLISYLTTTQEGMDKLSAVTRPLGAIFEKMKGVLQELGGSVFKGLSMILNGDFKEGFKVLGQGFVDVVDNTKKAISEGIEAGTALDQLEKKIRKTELELIQDRGKLNRVYNESREIAADETKSLQVRYEASKRAIAAQNELEQKRIEWLDLRIEKMKLEHTLNDTTDADLKELYLLEEERENASAEASRKRRTALTELNTLRRKISKISNDEEISFEAGKVQAIKDMTLSQADYQVDIAKMASEKIKKVNHQLTADHQQQSEMRKKITAGEAGQMLGGFASVFGNIANMHEKGSEQYKKFSKIQATIAAFQASINAYNSMVGIPFVGPALAPIAAVAALKFGLDAAKQIDNMAFPSANKPKVERFQQGGILKGNRHSNGGIPGMVRSTGRPIEMEDGEIILTRGVGMSPFGRSAASQLNAMFGGKRFESGGPVNPLPTKNETFAPSAGGTSELVSEFRSFKEEIRNWQRELVVINSLQQTEAGLSQLKQLRSTFEV